MDNGLLSGVWFFILLGAILSHIFESFFVLCSHECLSPHSLATKREKETESQNLWYIYWGSKNTSSPPCVGDMDSPCHHLDLVTLARPKVWGVRSSISCLARLKMNEINVSHNNCYISIYISYTECNIHYGTVIVLCEMYPKSIETEVVFTKREMNNDLNYFAP